MCPFIKPISRIGLGCVTFGREIDRKASFAMMDYAFDRGITFFDTAAAYGLGASETIVGEWLYSNQSAQDAILLATKILPPYTAEVINTAIDQSLQRLNTKSIDLLYLHSWHDTVKSKAVLKALNEWVKDGKIKSLGASNFNGEQLAKVIQLQKENGFEQFRFAQNNNNLAVSDISPELRANCVEQGVNIVSYSPLGAGFLTGKHKDGIQSGTRFALLPAHQDIYFQEKAYHRLAKLHIVAAQTGYSPIMLALAWAMHQKEVASVLIGGRTVAHIDQALIATAFNDTGILNELECP